MFLKEILPPRIISKCNWDEREINGIKINPYNVSPGDLFIALPPLNEGENPLVKEALSRGAAMIIKNKLGFVESSSTIILEVDDPRKMLAEISSKIYPSQPEIIAGVTGTSGKTSVVSFTRQLWELLGHKAASIGSLGIEGSFINIESFPFFGATTPEAPIIHFCLDRLQRERIKHVAMETTCVGIDWGRIDKVNFTAAAFTNFSHEHLSYYKTLEAYFEAKAKFFSKVLSEGTLVVLNREEPKCKDIYEICKKRRHKVLWVGYKKGDFNIEKLRTFPYGVEATLRIFDKRYVIPFNLIGDFQVENALMALALVVGLGSNVEKSIEKLKLLQKVPGRMELIGKLLNGASIYIDYAHAPIELERALKALKKQTKGKITLVIGCGGTHNLDPEKPALLGKIAHRFADKVIITDDNPRNEDPKVIRSKILANCFHAREIPSRADAIRTAITELNKQDTCLIAGKGQEKMQIIRGELLPFNDQEEAEKFIKALGGKIL